MTTRTTRTKRVMLSLTPEMYDELKSMADVLNMPLSTFIYTMLEIGVSASGSAFRQFGNTLEGIRLADAEHDSKP